MVMVMEDYLVDKRNLFPKSKTNVKNIKVGFTFQLFGWNFFIGLKGDNKKEVEVIQVSEVE